MTTRLLLIRHGETDWSVDRRYCGSSDIPLNENGKLQASRLAQHLMKEAIDCVYSSHQKRAREFAVLAVGDQVIIELRHELVEMDFGLFEGLTYDRVMARCPEVYSAWLDDPVNVSVPHGENLKDLALRVRGVIKEIVDKNQGKTIAVFTHGGPIKIILCDIFGWSLNKVWQIKHDLAQMRIINFKNGKGQLYQFH